MAISRSLRYSGPMAMRRPVQKFPQTLGENAYYVAATGSDAATGTSPATPWATVSKVNSVSLRPGDTVNFNGGDTFSGTKLYVQNSGNPDVPITFQSYGTGTATISVSGDNLLYCYDSSNITIQNLSFVGSSTLDGLVFYNDLSYNQAGITLSGVSVTGSNNGLSVGGATNGYTGFMVTNSTFSGNTASGVNFYGPTFTGSNWAHSNVTITGCAANSNPGLATNTTAATGFGMTLGSINSGTVSQCVTHGNGASNGDSTSGPVGLMVYSSNAVTVTNSVSYGNAAGGLATDGDGFDLDINCSSCIIEYCISYSNAGAGILLFGSSSNSYWTNNTARFNICWGNATSNSLAEIYCDGTQTTANIYNNTCIGRTARPVVYAGSSGTKLGVQFWNNIFYSGSTGSVVKGVTAFAESAVQFTGNLYYATGTFGIAWGANTRTSLSSWQTSDTQEKIGATLYGVQGDPQLGTPGSTPSVTSAVDMSPASGLQPATSGSLSATGGQNVSSLTPSYPLSVDFFGRAESFATLPFGASLAGFNAVLASVAAVAQSPTVGVSANTALAAVAATAYNPTVAVSPSASLAMVAAVAQSPMDAVAPHAALATVIVVAGPAPASVAPNAGMASVAATAYNPTVTAGRVVTPSTATVAVTAYGASDAATVQPGVATVASTAQLSSSGVAANAALATVTTSAYAPTAATSRTALPATAIVTTTVYNPSPTSSEAATPSTATVSATAYNPTVSTWSADADRTYIIPVVDRTYVIPVGDRTFQVPFVSRTDSVSGS